MLEQLKCIGVGSAVIGGLIALAALMRLTGFTGAEAVRSLLGICALLTVAWIMGVTIRP
jgi:hypothetical protein